MSAGGSIWTGRIIKHPLRSLNGELRFKPVLALAKFNDKAVTLEDWGSFSGILIKILVEFKDNRSTILGNGVIIGPGLALCAQHVIRPIREMLENGKIKKFAAVAANGNKLDIWNIKREHAVDGPTFKTDLNILSLEYASELPHDLSFNCARITTRIPKVGERVLVAGYQAHKKPKDQEPDEQFFGDIVLSAGTVTQLYSLRRDSVFCPGPSILVDCPTWPGMSGGPVFNKDGFLIGVLTSSEQVSKEEQNFTYVSLVWPALLRPILHNWLGSFPNGNSLLHVNGRYCFVDNPHEVECIIDAITGGVIGLRHYNGGGDGITIEIV